jgi:hypothetical protein
MDFVVQNPKQLARSSKELKCPGTTLWCLQVMCDIETALEPIGLGDGPKRYPVPWNILGSGLESGCQQLEVN